MEIEIINLPYKQPINIYAKVSVNFKRLLLRGDDQGISIN
jgi:hypothetical protein